MKKILLITGSFGNGHLQVSKALREVFQKKYKNKVEVVESDLFLQAHPNLTPILKRLYLYSFSYFRDIYGYLYYAGKNQEDTSFYRYFSYEYLKKIIKDEEPDIIVSTFPTPALSLLDGSIPIVNVVTDYHFHKSWLTKNAYGYYVATEESKKYFIEAGVDEKTIKVFGIPIAQKFDEKIAKKEWIEKNNLGNLPTILLSAGAFGVSSSFSNLISEVLEVKSNIQVVVICGKNKELYGELFAKYAENNKVKILGYTNEMREWMQVSDVLITKAGGVTISEAQASKIPLILFDPVPGQEMENALYFEKKSMAKIAKTNEEVVENLKELFTDDNLENFKKNMGKNYREGATKNICEDIVKILENF